MKQKERHSSPAIGGSSLLVIFAVLCLTVFSLLALNTALAEKRLSDTAASAVKAYYEADLEAVRIFARLRAGETVPGVDREENRYYYRCPVSESQSLLVELEKTGDSWRILRWQTSAQAEDIDQNLPVWDGK